MVSKTQHQSTQPHPILPLIKSEYVVPFAEYYNMRGSFKVSSSYLHYFLIPTQQQKNTIPLGLHLTQLNFCLSMTEISSQLN